MIIKKVTNKTKNTVLAKEAEVADTFPKRLKGLLGRSGLNIGQGFIIIPCSSIHTFFMKFPIDAIFLDKNNRVVALAESLSPSRLFGSWLKGRLVIELSAGTITKTQTTKGDQIDIS